MLDHDHKLMLPSAVAVQWLIGIFNFICLSVLKQIILCHAMVGGSAVVLDHDYKLIKAKRFYVHCDEMMMVVGVSTDCVKQ